MDRSDFVGDYGVEMLVAKQNFDGNFGRETAGGVMTFVLHNASRGIAHFGFAECDGGVDPKSAERIDW